MNDTEPTHLTREEIPQGVIDDLEEHFGEVSFELDSDSDNETRSLKSNYFDKGTKLEEGVVCEPETFKAMKAMGYQGTSYLVRINEIESGCIVRKVITMSIFDAVSDFVAIEETDDD